MHAADDFAIAERELRESLLVGWFVATCTACGEATRHSRVFAGAMRTANDVRAMTPPARLYAISLMLTVAIAAHLVLLVFVPAHAAPAIPRAIWLAAAAVSASLALVARSSCR
jgi:hypothetical protein